MPVRIKHLFFISVLLLSSNIAFAAKGVTVVYPEWFKNSLYDLPSDLQDARDAGKTGIMLFFSTKSCSYCKAIIETTFSHNDIVKRLRNNYDVIGLEVLSDIEVVNTAGKSLWAKDFAVQARARFTPTMIFYDSHGKVQLRLVGYQSPAKFRGALSYLEGGHYKSMKLSQYLQQNKPATKTISNQTSRLNLNRRQPGDKPLLVVFENTKCDKCQQLRTMLKKPALHSYTQKLDIAFIDSANAGTEIMTPMGKKTNGKAWAEQLALIHSPAMVFFNEQGKEVLRVDTDILIDQYGKKVSVDDGNILDNIRARLQFVIEKGYIALPQFQRWRTQQSRQEK